MPTPKSDRFELIEISEQDVETVDEHNQENLSEHRERLEVAYEDDDVVVFADAAHHPEMDVLLNEDLPDDIDRSRAFSELLSVMWDRVPDSVDSSPDSLLGCSHPISVPKSES